MDTAVAGMAHGFGATPGPVIALADLGRLMPLYLRLDADGAIADMGPTLVKILGADAIGHRLGDLFDIRTPRGTVSLSALVAAPSIRLALRRDTRLRMTGAAVPLPDPQLAPAGALLNLSFGYSLADAVRRFSLSQQDFAATDMAVELLYLLEAKNLVSAEVARMERQMREARQHAEDRARTDALTGLGNRRALDEVLAQKLALAQGFCVINLDLDFFKAVNDTLGHAAGDHVLVEIGEILRHAVRGGDAVARVGGDEFVIVLSSVVDTEVLAQIGTRLLKKMAVPILYNGQPCNVAMSMGAAFHHASEPLDALMARADAALYASKNAGRRRLTLAMRDGRMIEMAVGEPPLIDRRARSETHGRHDNRRG